MPFLPVDPNLPANKNGARQKLATLAVSRFHLLCSDVMHELETRFPVIVHRFEDQFGSGNNNDCMFLSDLSLAGNSSTGLPIHRSPKYEDRQLRVSAGL